MKFHPYKIVALVFGCLGIPAFVYAAVFAGACKTATGGASSGPSDCNIPGVIWNVKGVTPPPPPQDAEININGRASIGDPSQKNSLLGDTILTNGKNFQVNDPISSNFSFENNPAGTQNPFTLNINGGLNVNNTSGAPSLGQDGRVQAVKFCLNPFGGPVDCITSWPSGGGGGGGDFYGKYVSSTGDTMTGGLTINFGGGYGIDAKGTTAGGIFRNTTNLSYVSLGAPGTTLNVQAQGAGPAGLITTSNSGSDGLQITLPSGSSKAGLIVNTNPGFESDKGILSYANLIGGEFWGATYGVNAKARSAGSGTAVRGFNGNIGGDFTGASYGVTASGGFGGYFTSTGGSSVYLGAGSNGMYSFTPATTDFGLFTTGQVWMSGDLTVGATALISGDMDVSGNQWGGPSSPTFDGRYGGAWPNLGGVIGWSSRGNRCGKYIASGVTGYWICPDGAYMAGYQTDGAGKVINGVCCEL